MTLGVAGVHSYVRYTRTDECLARSLVQKVQVDPVEMSSVLNCECLEKHAKRFVKTDCDPSQTRQGDSLKSAVITKKRRNGSGRTALNCPHRWL